MNIIRQPFRYRNDNAVFWLIGINILVFIAMYFFGDVIFAYLDTGRRKIALTIKDGVSMMPLTVVRGWVWTFVTYMFVHGGVTHILFNMFALFIFGTYVERYMGSREFLLFYFVTGALAGVFSFGVYYFTSLHNLSSLPAAGVTGVGLDDLRLMHIRLMGASGAIFAVELAYAVFYPDSVIYLWGILPLRAPVMVLGFTAIELASSIFRPNSGVAHLTHLAGFGFAWLYFLIRFGINPWRRLRLR